MATKVLITPFEVVRHSPAGRDYPTDGIAQLIPVFEQQYGHECLGDALYNWMLANANAYSEAALEWCSTSAYNIGDQVTKNGLLYESTTDMNTTDPLCEGAEWAEVQRFAIDCANELWEEHLRQIFAMHIFIKSLNRTTRTTGANGLTVLSGAGSYNNQGFTTADSQTLNDYKTQLNEDLRVMVLNMIRWAQKQSDSTCGMPISTMPGCTAAACAPQSNQRRRWAFKH